MVPPPVFLIELWIVSLTELDCLNILHGSVVWLRFAYAPYGCSSSPTRVRSFGEIGKGPISIALKAVSLTPDRCFFSVIHITQIGQASAGRCLRYSSIEILPSCGVSLQRRLSHGYSTWRFSHSLPSPCFQASKSRSRQKRGLRPVRRSCSAVTGSRCRNGSSRGTSGRGCVTSM